MAELSERLVPASRQESVTRGPSSALVLASGVPLCCDRVPCPSPQTVLVTRHSS